MLAEAIKERWSLRSMAARFGIELPTRDGVKFCHPFRPDQNPSCTIKDDRLYDWSQGCGKSMDCIGLYASAKGIDESVAIIQLHKEIKGEPIAPAPKPKAQAATKPAKPPFQKLEEPTTDDLAALAKLRNIFDSSLRIAAEAGHLFFADTKEGRCYVVTDSSRRVCQSRRLDGEPWKFIASKAWTSIKEHGAAGWPLGASDIGTRQRVILCEGGPDWLVAHEAGPDIAVCAMLGAKQTIHAGALPLFDGKAVRVLAHGDDAGAEACKRWAAQLTAAGATVTAIKINFGEAKDLNDCAYLPFEQWKHFKISSLLS